jgi:plastocyanin
MKGRLWLSALAISAGMCSVTLADVTGKVTFDGAAPKPKVISMKAVPDCDKQHTDPVYDETWVVGAGGEVKNVVVYVKEGAKLGGAALKDPLMLDQKGCMYSPRVVAAMVGQEIKAQNSDKFLHNVHTLGKANPEKNFPQTQQGQVTPIEGATTEAETYIVKCDVHPWMKAWIVVLDHPFFAVTGDDGTFDIKGLKDGKYTLVAWHEPNLTQEAEVEVKDGKATADFKVAPKKKAAAADTIKEIREVLAVTKPADEQCEECNKAATPVVAKDAKPAQSPVAAK